MQTLSKLKLRLKRIRKDLTGFLDKQVAQNCLKSYCKKDPYVCRKTYFRK
jgi:hypothetical protein